VCDPVIVCNALYPGVPTADRLVFAKANLSALRLSFVATGFAPVSVDIPFADIVIPQIG
jgi:hypothetical protein